MKRTKGIPELAYNPGDMLLFPADRDLPRSFRISASPSAPSAPQRRVWPLRAGQLGQAGVRLGRALSRPASRPTVATRMRLALAVLAPARGR